MSIAKSLASTIKEGEELSITTHNGDSYGGKVIANHPADGFVVLNPSSDPRIKERLFIAHSAIAVVRRQGH